MAFCGPTADAPIAQPGVPGLAFSAATSNPETVEEGDTAEEADEPPVAGAALLSPDDVVHPAMSAEPATVSTAHTIRCNPVIRNPVLRATACALPSRRDARIGP